MHEFKMPMLGADMEAGTLVEWSKQPGDAVKRGDIIAVVDTQKGAIEIEVFEDGIIDRVLVPVGTQVPVGTVLAMLRGATEPAGGPTLPALSVQATRAAAPAPPAPATQPPSPTPVRATPVARRRAADLGLDLAAVSGTGPQGAITREDVEREAARRSPPSASAQMRAAIAAAMSRGKREIPHYYLATSIDFDAAHRWLRTQNDARPIAERLLPVALLLKAVALALADVPELNGHWIDGAFRPGAGVHIGCAIALRGGGLVAPALHDANRKDLPTIMRDVLDLTARARAGALKSSELADPTITLTNLGDQGVETAFGIVTPPQVALVGFGRIADEPRVVDAAVVARPSVTATLAADHRVSDGHRGGLFLTAVTRRLQHPEAL
jgi:pyruvate dehydrogenase E2 component (dihydrolipoamide acetyltransferase)